KHTAARQELDRIRHEILEHEPKLALVGSHAYGTPGDLQPNLLVRDGQAMLAQHAEDEPLELEFGDLERGGLRLPSAEVQQVLDERLELQAVLAQDAGDLLLLYLELADGTVQQQLGALADVGEGGLELVRHVAQELVFLLALLLEALP